jgi:uncharacterized protein (DUF362 family)
LVKIDDRKTGVATSIATLDLNPVKDKKVLIKPNFNTADVTPGSTHNDTLSALVEEIWRMGARTISLGERSYPQTHEVMKQKGIPHLLEKLDVQVINFDDLEDEDWLEMKPEGSHWRDGFRIARPVMEAECLVSTCCLKTHQFGGVFSMSLKLHVGVVPTQRNGFGYMSELHQSPYQQEMIAEINAPFTPSLIVLDGIDAFVDGGPMSGKHAKGNVFLASTDRVAVDAVGVAVLKSLGSNHAIMSTGVFQQRQIARAVQLGLGVSCPEDIDLMAAEDDASSSFRDQISSILNEG